MKVEVYGSHRAPATRRKGGGVGILLRDSPKFTQHPCFQSRSFENCQLAFTSGGVIVRIAVVNRLYPTKFFDLLDLTKVHLLILVKFNIHPESPSNANTKYVSSTLKSANLTQHVHEDDTFVK